jgi:hypothetical protein
MKKIVIMINYSHFLVRWLELFPRENLLLVNGDQLIDDPLSQIRRIENFLGNIKLTFLYNLI